MPVAAIKNRVDILETETNQFKRDTIVSFDRLERIVSSLALSTKTFQNEMKDFKDEMSEFKDEMKEFKVEMSEFKDEMKDFKVEMSEFKDRMESENKRMNKQWGELANKMGTVVEDIVAPNLPRIAEECFKFAEIDDFMIRRKRIKSTNRSCQREFDAIVVSNNAVILNETKSTPRPEYIKDYIDFLKRNEFFEYFPEYKGKQLIPIFSSLYMEPSVIKRLTKNKIYAMAMNDSTMAVLNFNECQAMYEKARH